MGGVKQDKEFAFDDANIVLIAGPTAFCIHRGVLSHCSEVFQDLFSIPQPDNAESFLDLPVVEVQDKAADIRYLLRYLYGNKRYYDSTKTRSFTEVAALVRLGHKYQIHPLLDDALTILKSVFTDDFDTFFSFFHPVNPTPIPAPLIEIGLSDAADVIILARLVGAERMLPVAYYLCCLTDPDKLVERLPLDSLAKCMRGISAIAACTTCEYTKAALRIRCSRKRNPCTAIDFANTMREGTVSFFLTWFKDEAPRLSNDPMRTAVGLKLICPACQKAMLGAYRKLMRSLWIKLPDIFGLGSWSQLK